MTPVGGRVPNQSSAITAQKEALVESQPMYRGAMLGMRLRAGPDSPSWKWTAPSSQPMANRRLSRERRASIVSREFLASAAASFFGRLLFLQQVLASGQFLVGACQLLRRSLGDHLGAFHDRLGHCHRHFSLGGCLFRSLHGLFVRRGLGERGLLVVAFLFGFGEFLFGFFQIVAGTLTARSKPS